MAANYAALQTTGHNIANANVDGYSRQRCRAGHIARAVHRRGLLRAGCGRGHGEPRARQFLTARQPMPNRWRRWTVPGCPSCSGWRSSSRTAKAASATPSASCLNAMSDLSTSPNDLSARQVVLGARETWPRASGRSRSGAGQCAGQCHRLALLRPWPTSTAWPRALPRPISRSPRCRGRASRPTTCWTSATALISKLSEQVQVTRMDARTARCRSSWRRPDAWCWGHRFGSPASQRLRPARRPGLAWRLAVDAFERRQGHFGDRWRCGRRHADQLRGRAAAG
jgi:flagellar hook-associated protein 1 FlgK